MRFLDDPHIGFSDDGKTLIIVGKYKTARQDEKLPGKIIYLEQDVTIKVADIQELTLSEEWIVGR